MTGLEKIEEGLKEAIRKSKELLRDMREKREENERRIERNL